MTHPVKSPKKLIEVALPLDAINVACVREKSIRHGHPSTLHLWWARRPLAAARAVIFSQMVNDPSWKWEMEHLGEVPPGHLKASWAASRKRLFKIIEDLVLWENTTNEVVLERARTEKLGNDPNLILPGFQVRLYINHVILKMIRPAPARPIVHPLIIHKQPVFRIR